jgi:hypothetical protein
MHDKNTSRAFFSQAFRTSVRNRRFRRILSVRSRLPNHPTWLERVPDILSKIQCEKTPPILDRQAIEDLFGVRRRQAITLLHRLAGYKVGRTFVVPREAVIEFLQKIAASGAIEEAAAKKNSLIEFLGQAKQSLQLPSIPLPATTKLSEITFHGLPPGIRLQPDELTIHFQGAPDLLQKLLSLSQALANDFETLEGKLAAGGSHER